MKRGNWDALLAVGASGVGGALGGAAATILELGAPHYSFGAAVGFFPGTLGGVCVAVGTALGGGKGRTGVVMAVSLLAGAALGALGIVVYVTVLLNQLWRAG
jgi:hypothetical protein